MDNEIPAEFELTVEEKHLDTLITIGLPELKKTICKKCLIAVALEDKFPHFKDNITVGFTSFSVTLYEQGTNAWRTKGLTQFTNLLPTEFIIKEKQIRAMLPATFKFTVDIVY